MTLGKTLNPSALWFPHLSNGLIQLLREFHGQWSRDWPRDSGNVLKLGMSCETQYAEHGARRLAQRRRCTNTGSAWGAHSSEAAPSIAASLPHCLGDLPQSPQPRSRTKPGAAPRGPLLKVNPFVLGTLPAPTRGRLRASSNHRTTYSQRPARAAPSAVIRQQRGLESPSATVGRVLNGTISRTRQGARELGKMGSLEEAAIETATPPPPAAAE